MNYKAGSSWNYETTNRAGPIPIVTTYTVTSTSRDTLLNGRSYHIFNTSNGGKQFYNVTANDYYQFDTLPAALSSALIERLYLKDNLAVNATWAQTFNVVFQGFPIPITATNTIVAKDISRTVNSIVYNNVIHVSTSLTLNAPIPGLVFTTNINAYYAKKFGLIENSNIITITFGATNQSTNNSTRLMSSVLL